LSFVSSPPISNALGSQPLPRLLDLAQRASELGEFVWWAAFVREGIAGWPERGVCFLTAAELVKCVSEKHGTVEVVRFNEEAVFSQFVGFLPSVSLCADVKAHFRHGGLLAGSRRNQVKRGFGFGKIAKFKPPLGFG
jgi:hypothetical protein